MSDRPTPATLNLTEAEKAASSYLDWPDETISKAVRNLALLLGDSSGARAMQMQAAALFLACEAFRANSEITEITLSGATEAGESRGDWRITLERLDSTP